MSDEETEEKTAKNVERREPRSKGGVEVLCSSGRDEGTATLVNLSPLGALLDPATLRPAMGSSVSIRFPSSAEGESQVLTGVVVRQTPKGFAVQFPSYLPTVSRLIAEYEVGG